MPVPAHPNCRCCIIPRLDELTLSQPYDNINESKYIGIPASSTEGDNKSVRLWYYTNIHNIPNMIDYNLPIKEQAQQAFKMRNDIKLEARAAMTDRETAENLNQTHKITSFDDLIKRKMYKYGCTKQEAYSDIIRSSATTNADIDKDLFGG